MGRQALALMLGLAVQAACRGDVKPYVVEPTPWPGGDTVRLTFAPGDDRSPTWLGNDSIAYSSSSFDPFPAWPAVLAQVPRGGGTARLLFPAIHQSPVTMRLVTPVASPGGDRIAFLDLAVRQELCPSTVVYGEDSGVLPIPAPPIPPLVSARLFVRGRGDQGAPSTDPQLTLDFPGVKDTVRGLVPGPAGTPTFIVRDFPFQRVFRAGGTIPFRPSWSPDGQRLVFSDGGRLLVWKVGDAQAAALPGGERGTVAAWSPRGDQIAFARPDVSDSTTTFYLYYAASGPTCSERRVNYGPAVSRLMVLPAAGGVPRELGLGDEPAWTPDGAAVYARSASGQTVRIPVAGGAAVPVPGPSDMNDLAVSPDGNWLAFTRRASNGNHDVWAVRLSH